MEELHAVETKQVEEETLDKKFSRFRAEIKKLQQKPEALQKKLSAKQGKLERLRNGHLSNLALGDIEEAETLSKAIEPLSQEVSSLAGQIGALGQSAQNIVSNAPGSEMFNLAAEIVDQAADLAPQLEADLQNFITYGSDELKEKYLEEIEKFSEGLAELWEISFAGLTAQGYLPQELRKCTKPRLVAPGQGKFEISVEEVADRYRPLSRTTLPD